MWEMTLGIRVKIVTVSQCVLAGNAKKASTELFWSQYGQTNWSKLAGHCA